MDMIAEKPSIHEMNIIFDKINRDKVIISDKEIIDTLRNPKEENGIQGKGVLHGN